MPKEIRELCIDDIVQGSVSDVDFKGGIHDETDNMPDSIIEVVHRKTREVLKNVNPFDNYDAAHTIYENKITGRYSYTLAVLGNNAEEIRQAATLAQEKIRGGLKIVRFENPLEFIDYIKEYQPEGVLFSINPEERKSAEQIRTVSGVYSILKEIGLLKKTTDVNVYSPNGYLNGLEVEQCDVSKNDSELEKSLIIHVNHYYGYTPKRKKSGHKINITRKIGYL